MAPYVILEERTIHKEKRRDGGKEKIRKNGSKVNLRRWHVCTNLVF